MKKDRQKADIFMPIYIGDYLGDTMELDAEAHGAYLLLLMTAWRRGGRLPADQAQLTGIARVKPKRWPQVWGLIARFFDVDGDALVQRRLTKELEMAVGRIEAASKNGKNGAQKRWGGDAGANGERIATLSAGDSHPIVPPIAEVVAKNASSPSPSKIPSEGDPPQPPKPFASIDPLTPHGLLHVVKVEVEKRHPELGLYKHGEWDRKSAREFCEDFAANERTDVVRAEVRRRAAAFAASEDKRITKGRWLVEDFCRAYNELATQRTESRRDPVLDAAVASRGGRPQLPPEKKAVAGGS